MEDNKVQITTYHKDYNLDKKDNLDSLPEDAAVFGLFAIIHEKPVNCRFVGESDNLRKKVKELYENPGDEGFAKFMQGPWIQMLVYQSMPGASEEERKKAVEDWQKEHDPKCDENGEYPK
jgi:hypothetical protein